MGWFKKLISDNDVLESSHIRIEKMADIVAQTGATIDSVESLIYKKEQHSKDMVDIGVICFPDADRPFFQVGWLSFLQWLSGVSHALEALPHQAYCLVIVQTPRSIPGGFQWHCRRYVLLPLA